MVTLLRRQEPKSKAKWLKTWRRETWLEKAWKKKSTINREFPISTKMECRRTSKRKRICIRKVEMIVYYFVKNSSSLSPSICEKTSQQYTDMLTRSNMTRRCRRRVSDSSNHCNKRKTKTRKILMISTSTWMRLVSSKSWRIWSMLKTRH